MQLMPKRILLFVSIILLCIFLAFFGLAKIDSIGNFWTTERNIAIDLANDSLSIAIFLDNEAQYPHGIEINFNGKIDSTALIGYGWKNGVFYLSETVSGEFEFSKRTDWYDDTCYVTYIPLNSTKGELKVNCKIFSSKK